MDQEKIDAFRAEALKQKERQEDVGAVVNSVAGLQTTSLITAEAQRRLLNKQSELLSKAATADGVSKVEDVLDTLTITTHVNQKRLVEQLEDLNEAVRQLPKDQVEFPEFPEFPEIPIPPDTVSVNNLGEVSDWLRKILDGVTKLELNPVINVESPTVQAPKVSVDAKPDLGPLLKAVEKIGKAPDIKIPDNKKAFTDLQSAVKDITKAIKSLSFPVPNYVLPFKDSDGNATQAVVGDDGTFSTSESITKKLIDDTTTTSVTYIGEAALGTATSAASWRIKKVDESGSPTSITWTGATAVWDDRVTESYS